MDLDRTKVLVDTCVLLSSSIFLLADELKIQLKHHFYDYSNPLMSFLRLHMEKRIGLTTTTVENEARTTLTEAVMDTLIETIEKENPDDSRRIKIFGLFASFCDACSDKLASNISYLPREPVPEVEKSKWLPKADYLFETLKDTADSIDLNEIAKSMSKYVPKEFRKMAAAIYKEQKGEELGPIIRLTRKPPGRRDKEILSEAAYLKEYYESRLGSCKFFIASTDYHFSPFRGLKGLVPTLAKEIEKEFGIICNWPDLVLEEIRK